MVDFRLEFKGQAEEDLRAVPFPARRQINQRLFALKAQPLPNKISDDWEIVSDGPAMTVRLRLHGWRIIYQVDCDKGVVTIFGFRPARP